MVPTKTPQPDCATVEALFQRCLVQLDLPPDKLKILRDYPVEKKWEIIQDRKLVCEKHPPSYYVNLLRALNSNKTCGFRRKATDECPSKVLTGLEISLRTNTINWVDRFLSSECDGLSSLTEYLRNCLELMRSGEGAPSNDTIGRWDSRAVMAAKKLSKSSVHSISKKGGGVDSVSNEIRLCIMCMKAIMNNQNGFNMVLQHPDALDLISCCLCHKNRRTKALVLDLLAAVCLVEEGHELVLRAFDNCRTILGESRRFELLVKDFTNTENFDIDFMVSCIQFMNIVVHSVQNMDYRVALQYEFASLGLDAHLTRLRIQYNEAEQLQIQVQAYLDNCIDVGQLLDDSESKSDAVKRVTELEEQLSVANEKMRDMENDQMEQIACLKRQLHELRKKTDCLQLEKNDVVNSLDMLRKSSSERSSSCSYDYQSVNGFAQRLPDSTSQLACANGVASFGSCSSVYSTVTGNYTLLSENQADDVAPAPPPLPAGLSDCPPPPPPLPSFNPPSFNRSEQSAVTIKKPIETKNRLPCLNWVALKPQQVKGTIFCELNEDKYYKVIDFEQFEELFKTSSGLPINQCSTASPQAKKKIKPPASLTFLDGQRQRNLAIARRKLNMTTTAVTKAINNLDLTALNCENVEILQHFVPTESETNAFHSYIADNKDVKDLSKEDQFLFSLIRVERLSQKLAVMSFMGNFNDVKCSISPQLKAVLTASLAVRNSEEMKRLLEIILAFGNYMNSSKRGPVYGFKLQSLESLGDIRSHDKKMTLLHFIVLTIGKNFPELLVFPLDAKCLEKASAVSLDNVHSDVQELNKGLDVVRKEYCIRRELKSCDGGPPIGKFLEENEGEISNLIEVANETQLAFNSCVQYYGESPKTQTPSTFFGHFVKFQRALEQAQTDLKEKFKMDFTSPLVQSNLTPSFRKDNPEERKIEEKRILRRMEVTEGTIESLLDDLKRAPYIRADAVRRNRRKTNEIARQ